MTHSPLTNAIALTSDSDSRNGQKVSRFIVHHAATTSLRALLDDFAPGGREVSANYALGPDGTLVLTVDEDRSAWTSASWYDDIAVTIEVCNSQAGGSWPVSDATFDKLARLIADVSLRHGFPVNDDTVLTHQELWTRFGESYPTACPGDLQRRKAELLALANHYRAGGTSVGTDDEMTPEDRTWFTQSLNNLYAAVAEAVRREERFRLYYCPTPPAGLPQFVAIDPNGVVGGGRNILYANDGEAQARLWRDRYYQVGDTVEQAKRAPLDQVQFQKMIDFANGVDSAYTNNLAK